MSAGDSRVEKYMPAIRAAIERAGIGGQAATDIYNRAYEAIWNAIRDHEPNQKPVTFENVLRKQGGK